jgi:hypothetical protein
LQCLHSTVGWPFLSANNFTWLQQADFALPILPLSGKKTTV